MGVSSFPSGLTTFKDTKGCGRIVVRGFTLEVDEDGFIEAPADVAREIEPHGFIQQGRPAKQPLGLPGKKP